MSFGALLWLSHSDFRETIEDVPFEAACILSRKTVAGAITGLFERTMAALSSPLNMSKDDT